MNLVIDTCTLINISNSGCLNEILSIDPLNIYVGDIVIEEVNVYGFADWDAIETVMQSVASDDVPADLFIELISTENLGDGEAECIAIADRDGYVVCTDDGKARNYVKENYGEERLTGSLGLLRMCVQQGIKTKERAYKAYRRMVASGAFLPSLSKPALFSLFSNS